nr:MAG TPA: putative head tail adaptor [Caudoviricetes sp.]
MVTKKIRKINNQGTIGGMRDRIEFVERVNVHTNGGSGPYLQASFKVNFECWADHQKKEGIKIFNDVNIDEDFTDVFLIRKAGREISSKLFIRFDNKIYSIRQMLDYNDSWLLFKCKESGPEDKQANRK